MKPIKAVVLAALIFQGGASFADTSSPFDHSHGAWNGWLKDHVTVKGPTSTVDYKKAKGNFGAVKDYLGNVSAVSRATYDGWAANQKLAFLINAYNAFTVQLIVDNYPLKSIKDLGSLFKSPWKKEFFQLFGEPQKLDGIEHGIIRKEFKEPRIHVAVVCASIGCPMLRNEAWTADKLEAQFDDSVKLFLSDPIRNKYDAGENRFIVSKIFDWYGGDFKEKYGSVQAFLASYLGKTPEEKKKMADAKISYSEYDWKLNETK
jgi:hypothetical protein